MHAEPSTEDADAFVPELCAGRIEVIEQLLGAFYGALRRAAGRRIRGCHLRESDYDADDEVNDAMIALCKLAAEGKLRQIATSEDLLRMAKRIMGCDILDRR
jgi:hypothetical protein